MTTAQKPPRSLAGRANFWAVSTRTIKRWMAKAAPTHSVEGMAAWAPGQKNLPAGFLARLRELKAAAGPPADTGAEWREFLGQHSKSGAGSKTSLAAITKARDFASWKFARAAESGDRSEMKFFSDLLRDLESVIHDSELRARKLGIDQGELLPRSEIERLLGAVAYWLMRTADDGLDVLTSRLRALAPGLEAECVRGVLEPYLLNALVLEPMVRATRLDCGVTLAPWVVETMKRSCGNFLENSEREFESGGGRSLTPAKATLPR